MSNIKIKEESCNSDDESNTPKKVKLYRRKIYKKILEEAKAKHREKKLRKARRQRQACKSELSQLSRQMEAICLQ